MLNRDLKKTLPLVFLALCIAGLVLFTGPLGFHSHGHDCPAHECPVCVLINAVRDFLKTIKQAAVALLCAAVWAAVPAPPCKKNEYVLFFYLPFDLKVRFNS